MTSVIIEKLHSAKLRMYILDLCSLFIAKCCVDCWVAVMLSLGTAAFWKCMERFFIFVWVPKFWNIGQDLNNVTNDCRAAKSHSACEFECDQVLYLSTDLI